MFSFKLDENRKYRELYDSYDEHKLGYIEKQHFISKIRSIVDFVSLEELSPILDKSGESGIISFSDFVDGLRIITRDENFIDHSDISPSTSNESKPSAFSSILENEAIAVVPPATTTMATDSATVVKTLQKPQRRIRARRVAQ
jgi:hypothetical protein